MIAKTVDLYAAADGNGNLFEVLRSMQETIGTLTDQTGLAATNTPDKATLNVSGVDGTFIVQIVNPGDVAPLTIQQRAVSSDGITGQGIYHQVQSATGPTFDNSTHTVTYPVTQNTRFDITDPNKVYYWRVRSSFDGVKWNDWVYLSDATVCGVVPVWSGLLKPSSVMPSATGKETNFAVVDSVDAGATASVRVHGTGGPGTSWMRQVGSGTTGPYPSGSLTGKAFNTKYIVMYQPPDPVTGLGEQFFAYTTLPPSMSDTLIYVGAVTTVPSGGGTVATGTPIYSGISPNQVIIGVNITAAGSAYTSPPDVQFNGDSTGAGAAAVATIDGSGAVTGVIMTNQGANYTGNGTMDFVGGQDGVVGGGGTDGDSGGRYVDLRI